MQSQGSLIMRFSIIGTKQPNILHFKTDLKMSYLFFVLLVCVIYCAIVQGSLTSEF